MVMQLKKGIPIPYYYQIERILEESIEKGDYKVNDFLPSERELSSKFNVSKITIRKALSNLEFKGLIKKVKGKGSIIRNKKIEGRILNKMIGTFNDLSEMGFEIKNQILSRDVSVANEEVRKRLNIAEGEEVLGFERLRLIDNEPYQYSKSFIPEKLVPDFDLDIITGRSLYEVLENKYRLKINKITRVVEAEIASALDSKMFKVKEGFPILAFQNIAYINKNEPIEFSYNRIRGDLSKFQIDIVD
jgi:GntR family transcriptional regulator